MSKISNRIKKYAISNFDFHLDESLQMNDLDLNKLEHANLQQDQDTKLRQPTTKFAGDEIVNLINQKRHGHRQTFHVSAYGQNDEREPRRFCEDFATLKQNAIQRTIKDIKSRNKNFIELTNFQKLESEKNIALDHKIEKMRNGKLQPNQKENKRLYFSSHKEMGPLKQTISHINYSKKNDLTVRRSRKNTSSYVPIGYNGQRLQKKVSNISDLVKYNAHFIDMEISIDPGIVLMGSDGKQNVSKKQNTKFNLFQKTREKKCNQILNSKNVYHAVFRAPAKKVTDEERKIEFEKKFENFVNNFQKERVQLTFRELMQFKEIVYRKRQEEYFLAQQEVCHHQKSLNQITQHTIQKNITSSLKNNVMKKQEVSVQNVKNYQDLISAAQAQQDYNKAALRKGQKIPKAETNFSSEKPHPRKFLHTSRSFHFRKPSRRQILQRRKQETVNS